MTAQIFVYLFFSSFFGASLTQYLFFLGMQYTSATFARAFLNTTPALTFLIALVFRLETLRLKSKTRMAKVLGTIMFVNGTMLMTFYKGTNIEQNLSYPGPISPPSTHHSRAQFSEMDTRLTGLDRRQLQLGLLVRSPNKARQVLSPLFQHYLNLLSQLPSSCHTMYSYSTFSIWVLTNKNKIFVVIFAGLVGSGFGFLAVSWCVQKRGPVSTTAFSPLIQIIVAGIDFFILHGPLYLGSVLGSALVIAGLYFLLWGKTKEAQRSPVKQAPEISEGQAQGQTNV